MGKKISLSSFSIPRFGDTQNTESLDADPVSPTEMRVAVDEILAYEHDPRRATNAKLNEIRDSIRQRGFESTLDITRRPGCEHYVPLRGGNTTLRCIKEIYRETDNPDLAFIRCLFHPWVSEFETRLNHLVENDIRGDLIFIDRALAIIDIWEDMKGDTGEDISQSKLAEILRARGYRIDQTMISRMQYAVEKLHPCLPLALDAGLGFHQVVRLRQLEKSFIAYLAYKGLNEADVLAVAEEWFFTHLASSDSENWDIKPVIEAVISKLVALTLIPMKTVRIEIETMMSGGLRALEAVPINGGETAAHIPTRTDSDLPQTDPVSNRSAVVIDKEKLSSQVLESTEFLMDSIGGSSAGRGIYQLESGFALDLPEMPINLDCCASVNERKQAALWWLLAELFEQFRGDTTARLALLPDNSKLTQIGQHVAGAGNGEGRLLNCCADYVGVPTIDALVQNLLLQLNEIELVSLFKVLRGIQGLKGDAQTNEADNNVTIQ